MVRFILAASATVLLLVSAVHASDLCSRFKSSNLSRDYDVVGYTQNGVTGFLANPGTERKLDNRGVWFPANTQFIVYPKITMGPRVLVMSDTGVFAAIRPNALICLRNASGKEEERLLDVTPIYVGRRSRLHSVLQFNCNESQQAERERSLDLEFAPFNIVKVGFSDAIKTVASFDGESQKIVVYLRDPIEEETLKITEARSCEAGVAKNDPKWEIKAGTSDVFSINLSMLRSAGITDFDSFTERPIVSCRRQYDQLVALLNSAPVHKPFIPHLTAFIGQWDEFTDFRTCKIPSF